MATGAALGNISENFFLKLVFQAGNWTGYAQNIAASAETNINWALHTTDPGESGTMSNGETTYPNYARVAVPRSSAGFTVSNDTCTPVNDVNFNIANAATDQFIVSFSTGGAVGSSSNVILFYGAVTPQIHVVQNVTPVMLRTTSFTCD